jgi:uncharacterized tellurite resistance protein B-like protein
LHIILGLLGAIVAILVLLYRLADAGIDLGGLNPFLWRRRRSWRQQFEANPIFSLEDPKDLAAVLAVGMAKIDGDMSAEEKRALLGEFEATFALGANSASDLLASSAHLLGDARVLQTQLGDVLAERRDLFSPEQIDSLLAMLERIANVDGAPTQRQRTLLDGIREHLVPPSPHGTWG